MSYRKVPIDIFRHVCRLAFWKWDVFASLLGACTPVSTWKQLNTRGELVGQTSGAGLQRNRHYLTALACLGQKYLVNLGNNLQDQISFKLYVIHLWNQLWSCLQLLSGYFSHTGLSAAPGHLACFARLSGDLQLLACSYLRVWLLVAVRLHEDLLKSLHFERKIWVKKWKKRIPTATTTTTICSPFFSQLQAGRIHPFDWGVLQETRVAGGDEATRKMLHFLLSKRAEFCCLGARVPASLCPATLHETSVPAALGQHASSSLP